MKYLKKIEVFYNSDNNSNNVGFTSRKIVSSAVNWFFPLLLTLTGMYVFFSTYVGDSWADYYHAPLLLDGREIVLEFTDNNDNETLIIHTDQEVYSGWDRNDVYFSIENTINRSSNTKFHFLFNKDDVSVEQLWVLDDGEVWTPLAMSESPFALPEVANKKNVPNDFIISFGAEHTLSKQSTTLFKAHIRYPPLSGNNKFYIEAWDEDGAYGLLDPWYNNTYKYRRKITINNSQVATTTGSMNFTILATTTAASLKSTTTGGFIETLGAYDLVFVDDDNSTLLNFEREKHNTTTGAITYWVQTDLDASTDKEVYMYYGKVSGTDQSTTTGTWDEGYYSVYHLDESPSNGGVHNDSTRDNIQIGVNNFTTTGSSNGSTDATGYIAGADDFDGSDDFLQSNVFDVIDTDLTFESWAKPESHDDNNESVYSSNNENSAETFQVSLLTTTCVNKYAFRWDDQTEGNALHTCFDDVTVGKWEHLVATYDGSTLRTYQNGTLINSSTTSDFEARIRLNRIGRNRNTAQTRYFDGIIDEVRISTIARHANDITTTYNNQANMSAFLTYAGEERLFKGTVYTDEGSTNIGANKTVAVSINGAAAATTAETNASGQYEMFVSGLTSGDVVAVFLDDETENGATVTLTDTAVFDLDIYQNRLIVRSDSTGSALTNTHLDTADNVADADLTDFYTIASGNITIDNGNELFIPVGHIFQPGGTVTTNNIDINGTFILETNNATVLGGWDATGGTVFTTSTVTFATTTASTQTVTTNGNPFHDLTFNDSGGGATLSMQDQLNASSTIAITGGTITTNNNNIFVDGNWTNSDVFTAGTGTVTFTTTTATSTVTSGNASAFNVLIFNDSGGNGAFEIQDQLNASSTLSILDGTLDLNGNNIVADSTFSNDDTLLLEGGETVSLTNDTDSGLVRYDGGGSYTSLGAGDSYYEVAFSGSGTWQLDNQLNASSTVTISNGTVDANGNTILTDGNWSNSGTFTHGSGSVIFTTTTAAIVTVTSGGSPFHDLTFNDSGGGATLSMQDQLNASSTIAITGGTITTNNNNIFVDGNWTNSDVFTAGTGTVTFTTTTATSTVTTGGSSFYTLTLNDSGGSGAMTISDTTTITNLLINTSGTIEIDGLTTISGSITNSDLIIQDGSYLVKAATSYTADSASYNGNSGGTLTLTLIDEDLNLDGTVAETLSITITVTGGPGVESETITLTETGSATETFTGSIPITALSSSSGDGDLDLTNGSLGNIETTYTDAEDASDSLSLKVPWNSTSSTGSGSSSGGGGGGPPNPPPGPGSTGDGSPEETGLVRINNDETFTTTRLVALTLSASGASEMAISNNSNLSESGFEPYTTNKQWVLTEGDGEKTVYVRYRTAAGGTSQIISDTIILDTTPPITPAVIRPQSGAKIIETQPIISGTAEPGTTITIYLNGIRYESVSDKNTGAWSFMPPRPLTAGLKTLQITSKDGAGNVSNATTHSFTVVSTVVKPAPQQLPSEPIPLLEETPTLPPSEIKQPPIEKSDIEPLPDVTPPGEDTSKQDKSPKADIGNDTLGSVDDITPHLLSRIIETISSGIKDLFSGVGSTVKKTYGTLARFFTIQGDELSKRSISYTEQSASTPTNPPEFLEENRLVLKTAHGDINLIDTLQETKANLPSGYTVTPYIKPDRPAKSVVADLLYTTTLSLEPDTLKFLFVKPVGAAPYAEAREYTVQQLVFNDQNKDAIYESTFTLPVVAGEYTLTTTIDYEEGEDAVIELEFLIDPEGYVYTNSFRGQVRLKETKVSLFSRDPFTGEYTLWDAGIYDQRNPQITNETGEYTFLVPEGTYLLIAERDGYRKYQSDNFAVIRSEPIHLNIELSRNPWWLRIIEIFR